MHISEKFQVKSLKLLEKNLYIFVYKFQILSKY